METFIKSFVREREGVWRCVEPATLDLPGGRIQVTPGAVFTRGTRFMNVEIALLLEEAHRRQGQS